VQRTNDPERVAAIETRFRARLSWMLLGAVAIIRWGPLHPSTLVRGVLLALATAAFVGLNLPTARVLARARRERVAFVHWAPIAVAMMIRSAAYLVTVALAW
jgi:hypothetical protein